MLGRWWKWCKTEGDFRPCNYMHYETASEAVLSREARLCDSLASQDYDLNCSPSTRCRVVAVVI